MSKATSLVQRGPGDFQFEEFDIPSLSEGEVIIRVEATGLCASDIDSYNTVDFEWDGRPRILGHETVGIIEDMGAKSVNRQGMNIGDRVCVNPFVSCGICSRCITGDVSGCVGHKTRLKYGSVPIEVAPALWGGYSSHLYVPRGGLINKVPPTVSALDATLWQPIAGGFEWAIDKGRMRVGDRILILGPGQRGLGAVLAVRSGGASQVVVTGLARDQFKLDIALEIGADAVINVDEEDLIERGLELSDGEGFDVILDTTPHAVQPVNDAVSLLRRGGTLVVIGVKLRPLDGFPIDDFLKKRGTLVSPGGSSDRSYRLALNLIATNSAPLQKLRTHVFGFDQLGTAIETLQGKVAGENAINVVLVPAGSSNGVDSSRRASGDIDGTV